MRYEHTAIPDAEIPVAVEPVFQHVVTTYVSEANKTASMWRAVPDALLDYKPHPKTNPIRTILVHQLLSERRFFAQFVGTDEPPVEELLPSGDAPPVAAYIDKYVWLCRRRLSQFAAGTSPWWLEPRPFFGGLVRERIWIFWRRVLHTCHHRTQVQAWLRQAGHEPVPAIYGPSGDVKWDEADPTYSLEAARRGG
ncbi:DinB family protein [Zavarzinella formosa]|uniref:DinB family protein n=1 Tax=Zavarzinella formosa TaxID=360055 RepID=UPI0002EB4BA2|nr:DinB family protein [Zavarzinella formosa]